MLWNKNFSLLIVADVLLYWAVYLLFPLLHRWMMDSWGSTSVGAGAACAVFAAAMFLPGVFNSYLVDRYARKSVAVRSMLALGVLTLLYPYVGAAWMVWGLRVGQGVAFGIAIMATGATLAIDVTPSNKRTPANRVFAWASIIGMFLGLVSAWFGERCFPFYYLLYVSAGLCLVAVVLVSMVDVCFRAPLGVPLCSSDRFLLSRTLLPGFNLLSVPMVLGLLAVAVPDIYFYLCTAAGFLGYLVIRQVFTRPMNGRLQVFIGQVLTIVGLLLVMVVPDYREVYYVAAGCIGLGGGFSIGQFLRMMILLPRHCERASGFQTYQLLWETGFMLGALTGCVAEANLLALAFMVSVAGLILYQLYIHEYFQRNVEE